jgi:CDGSH-type Zn-finger protein/nucleotide-binding universal stress UspA family protein/nitrite reductase/ring-hydroxylating ferredoxin subunit
MPSLSPRPAHRPFKRRPGRAVRSRFEELDTTTEPEIKITPNGPYQINAELPITPKRKVLSDQGEPLTWATEDPIPHDTPTWLCRCGQSGHKPFCDGTHAKVGFVGTEVASTDSFVAMEKVYDGSGLKVHRVGSICQHSRFCENEVTDWYQMLPDTDDITVKGRVIDMCEHCPSGALVLELNGEILEPNYPKAVSPVEDGPYWVTGRVTIERADGAPLEARNRITLCRCGHSKNQPLCDGTHKEIGFVAKVVVRDEAEMGGGDEEDSDLIRQVGKRIVVGVSPTTSPATIEVAAMIASAVPSEIELVHAGSDEGVLMAALATIEEAGVAGGSVTSEQEAGSPVAVLKRSAADADADLLILERGGDAVSSVPQQIAYHSPCDVLMVATRTDRPSQYRRILIASDGSATADRAAKRGYTLARALGATVDLVFVGHPITGDLIVTDTIEAFGDGVETRSWVLSGNPVELILGTAQEVGADLIVVGNKGMTRARMVFGTSVPGGVLKGARCDLLLCRTIRQLESELEPGEGGVIERDGEHMAAYVDLDNLLHLMSAKCTHLGCVVAWNPGDRQFQCPCHGSIYDPLGEVVHGPATKPLRPIETIRRKA